MLSCDRPTIVNQQYNVRDLLALLVEYDAALDACNGQVEQIREWNKEVNKK